MQCDAPTLDWKGEPSRCGRWATRELGPFHLCWQHADTVTKQVEDALEVDKMRRRIERLELLIMRRQWKLSLRRNETRESRATVYFAQMPHLATSHPLFGLVKIGYASNLESRMAALQAVPIVTLPGGRTLEGKLHRQFAHLARSGEWFEPAPDLLSFIADIA